MRRLAFPALCLLLTGLPLTMVGGCKSKNETTSGKPKVVATFSVLGDLVKNVAGDKVDLVVLVGPDGDTHVYDPKPSDDKAIADAAVIFENGAGLEPWLDKHYQSTSSKAKRAVVTKDVKLREGDVEEHKHEPGKEHKHEAPKDPHVWHDVNNVILMVAVIRDDLAAADPANADLYKKNAAAYTKKLKELDDWVVKEVATLPKDKRKLVTNHDTFGYFADRYGFEIIGDALGSTTTGEKEPTAKQMKILVDKIKAAGVPVIFAENIENSKVIETLAKEAGVRVGPPLFTDALGKLGSTGGTYEDMMRHNVSTMVTELKKQ